MKKILLMLICILLLTSGCENKKEETIKPGKINCSEKDKILGYDNVVLIDVRTKEEYDEKHLDKAINIPYENIVEEIKKLDNINNDTHIIVYCKSGARSTNAYNSLIDAGYKNIYNLGAMSNCS